MPLPRPKPLSGARSAFRLAPVLLAFVALLAPPIGHASDPQSYAVTFASSGNRDLDAALKGSAQLEALRGKGPVGPFALIGRAQQDIERLQTVLQGYGYYQGHVRITVNGRELDDPELPAAIEAIPQGTDATVAVAIELGPLYRLREVKIDGEIPPGARDKLGIASGAPAVAADVLKAQARLLTALQEDGYALAKVDPPIAYEEPAAHALDVTFRVQAGPRVEIGDIRIVGLHDVHESLVRNRLLVHTGERFSPSAIEKARQDLLSLGVFSGVSARAVDKVDAQGRIPLVFDVQERLRHAVGLTAAYSTDLGGSLGATWSHRNLFGNAEQLNLAASATGLGGRATNGLGYNVTAQFVKPDYRTRDQSLELNAGAIQQKLDAYDQRAVTAGVLLNRKLSPTWSGGIGISAEKERIDQEMVTRDYTLLGFPVSAKYDSTGLVNPLDDPVRGLRAALTVTPTQSFGGSSATFVIIQGNASTYFDLGALRAATPGRSVLALRGLVGTAQGASQFALPPDQRFYGGGSATVRGFRYQSIGPQFPDGKPIGGTSIDAATIEFRQRLFGSFGAVAFVDAGQVGASSTPFQGTVHVGAGIGIRYYTAIGPVRLDVAVPLNKQPGNDAFEVYIGLGQAF